jgi:hypothetical protein
MANYIVSCSISSAKLHLFFSNANKKAPKIGGLRYRIDFQLFHFLEFRIGNILTSGARLLAAVRGAPAGLSVCLLRSLIQFFTGGRPRIIHFGHSSIDRCDIL